MKTLFCVAAMTVLTPAAADAAALLLTIGGSDTFAIDSDPVPGVPTFTTSGGTGFALNGVTVTHRSGMTELADLFFFQAGTNPYDEVITYQFPSLPGGALPPITIGEPGKQLYSGTLAQPHFAVGSYGTLVSIEITAAPAAGAVPEPATWATALAGFGLVGAALRRRRVSVRYG